MERCQSSKCQKTQMGIRTPYSRIGDEPREEKHDHTSQCSVVKKGKGSQSRLKTKRRPIVA